MIVSIQDLFIDNFNYNCLYQLGCVYLFEMDKKKRHTSGSRSKSKKSKPNEFSVDLKSQKIPLIYNQQQSKLKTENSVNKSKGTTNSKKKTKNKQTLKYLVSYPQAYHEIQSTKTMIQDISHSVSADRKHSLTKINRTEANYFETEDIQRKIISLKKSLGKISKPNHTDIAQIQMFYRSIQETIQYVNEPLGSILNFLHQLYTQPLNMLLQVISPYEDLIRKKQIITHQISQQIEENQRLYESLDSDNLQILQLQQKVQQQRMLIEEKTKLKMLQKDNKKNEIAINLQDDNRQMNPKNTMNFEGIGNKGFKLDLDNVHKTNPLGFHDQFYSKIDEFSQSWRNQAIRQKRF